MNLPNKLTVVRIFLAPLFLLILLWDFPFHHLCAGLIFGAAALTDLFDGRIARSQGLITNLGKFLDPLADKMLTTAAFLGFLAMGHLDVWAVMIILTREFLVTSVRLVAAKDGTVIAASFSGKAKTVAAMLEMEETPKRTGCCLLVDKEEIGSVGATGMQSRFFENSVAELLDGMGCYSELALRRALRNSSMLSSDVSAGYDPAYGEAFEKKNAAYLGRGIVLNKFTGARGKSGSNDANAEYVARVRRIFDDHNVAFQTAELGKVDFGGGGTIAYIAALYGMEVIDSGVAVLSMHAPWEVTSKADVYEAYKAYKAFLLDA